MYPSLFFRGELGMKSMKSALRQGCHLRQGFGAQAGQAFTLIELMIVVAIITFLAVLAVPQLLHYKAKAFQAEVAMNLASLHTAQQIHFAQHGSYTSVLSGENGLNWKPAGYSADGDHNFYYTYGFNVPGAQEGVHYFTGKLKASAQSLGATTADKDGFIAGAAGDVAGKNKMDVWAVNESRKIENVQCGLD
jgi:prepilin-type N-terminal cleavage/methylation domain-containing protein